MKVADIKIKTKNENLEEVSAVVNYNAPETLQEAVSFYGEPAVFSLVSQQLLTNVGNLARVALREGGDPQAAASSYIPGQKRERAPADPVQQAVSAFSRMDDTTKKKFLADLKAKMGLK